VLVVPDPAIVRGKFIVVFDDVFTDGNTLNTVARRLREAGATTVAGLALARAPWR
jgi:predicted amidophosphoribosyltransferase